jgi:hypothetical protein
MLWPGGGRPVGVMDAQPTMTTTHVIVRVRAKTLSPTTRHQKPNVSWIVLFIDDDDESQPAQQQKLSEQRTTVDV